MDAKEVNQLVETIFDRKRPWHDRYNAASVLMQAMGSGSCKLARRHRRRFRKIADRELPQHSSLTNLRFIAKGILEQKFETAPTRRRVIRRIIRRRAQ